MQSAITIKMHNDLENAGKFKLVACFKVRGSVKFRVFENGVFKACDFWRYASSGDAGGEMDIITCFTTPFLTLKAIMVGSFKENTERIENNKEITVSCPHNKMQCGFKFTGNAVDAFRAAAEHLREDHPESVILNCDFYDGVFPGEWERRTTPDRNFLELKETGTLIPVHRTAEGFVPA